MPFCGSRRHAAFRHHSLRAPHGRSAVRVRVSHRRDRDRRGGCDRDPARVGLGRPWPRRLRRPLRDVPGASGEAPRSAAAAVNCTVARRHVADAIAKLPPPMPAGACADVEARPARRGRVRPTTLGARRPTFRFSRDLRLDDHAGLAAAASEGEVLPVLVIDRACEALARSQRRAVFYCTAVAALDLGLRERGSKLIVRRGAPGPTLRNLARASGAIGVAWSASYDGAGSHADARLQSDLEEAGLQAIVAHDAPAIPPEETADASGADGGGYRAFVPYLAVWRECKPNTYELPLLLRFAASELPSEHLPIPAEFGAGDRASEIDPSAATEQMERFRDGCAAVCGRGQRTSRRRTSLDASVVQDDRGPTVVRATLDQSPIRSC